MSSKPFGQLDVGDQFRFRQKRSSIVCEKVRRNCYFDGEYYWLIRTTDLEVFPTNRSKTASVLKRQIFGSLRRSQNKLLLSNAI